MVHTQTLTHQNIHGGFTHIVMTIKDCPIQRLQLVADIPRIFIEQINKTFQHIQVEGGRNQFTMCTPFTA
jgi:hypothetical protein